MTQQEQKKLLAFMRRVETWRKNEIALEKGIKSKDPGVIRSKQTDITLDRMHIDRELPNMIKICTWHQIDLFEKKSLNETTEPPI